MQFAKKARVVLWGEPPATHAERKLLFKIDCLSFVCLAVRFCTLYFSNYLDRANPSSGMKEALNMTGHQFNNVNSMFTIGYTIAQIPQNLLLHVIPPRILFPINTTYAKAWLIWGLLTMTTAAATNVRHLYVIRFFQGMAEASTFVGAGSWYKETELGKRGAIFSIAASIYTNLNGLHGLAGGLITVPIALYGFLKSNWLFAVFPPKPPTKLDSSLIRRVFGRWRIYAMVLIWYIVGGELESIGSNSLMALWMKASVEPKYTIQHINYYPAGGTAVAIVSLLATAIWTDYTHKRYQVNFLIAVSMLISSVILLVYTPISTAGKFFAFYLAGVSYSGQASNFGWANDIARDDDEERSIILAAMNCGSNAVNAWWSIVFFPANEAPRWRKGMISIIVLVPILVLLTIGTRFLQLRDQRRADPMETQRAHSAQQPTDSKDEEENT
ncbi:MFS general substrate transporter [Favolaschia claudopus]|uniref:MFS general substrate transporter n=1 Tax=Favolaschia claudopus TaxID=2862362 RepID=A0AAW0B773_9AGAR